MTSNFKVKDINNLGNTLYGVFSVEFRDHFTGEVVDKYTEKNLVVEDAKASIMNAIAGNDSGHITEIRLGDDVGEGVNITGNPNLTFSDTDPDTITRDVGSWLDEGFLEKMTITITNTVSNNGTFTVKGVTHDTLTVEDAETLINEGPINNVNIAGVASLDNPEPPKDFYDENIMNLLYTATPLTVNFPDTRTVSFSKTILGSDFMLGFPTENFVEITSAALHTVNGDVFAYKRFPQRSISEVLDISIIWEISIFDPNSLLCGSTPFALPYRLISANSSATSEDYTIGADATLAPISINLPNAVGIEGRIYVIKKIDLTSNSVTLTTSAGQTIDGNSTFTLTSPFESVTIQSDNNNWIIL